MNYAIACDLEGIAGVVGFPNEGLGTSKQYDFAKKQAVREINAAANALFDNGADKVYVWDNHNGSLNLDYLELDKRIDIVAGVGAKHRWPGLYDKDISAVLLLGYHPMADTYAGILSHTCSSSSYQYVQMNGRSVGEIDIDAASAGRLLKAPVIFVASDNKAIVQAKEILPWIKSVETKEAIGRNLAVLKHPLRVVDEIYETVKDAVANLSDMQLYTIEDPVNVEIRFLRLEDAEKVYKSKTKDVELVDAFTVRFTAASFLELY
ncbi:MAG: peptidase M55 [Spirochaetales bacterium]|nr:peptidase M55 [Spirochaetales bacterium]